jgi:hypothetical protein
MSPALVSALTNAVLEKGHWLSPLAGTGPWHRVLLSVFGRRIRDAGTVKALYLRPQGSAEGVDRAVQYGAEGLLCEMTEAPPVPTARARVVLDRRFD